MNGFAGDLSKHVRLAGLLGSAVLLAGCSGGVLGPPKPPPARVAANPAAGARDVSPADPIGIGVSGGKLTNVALTSSDGVRVPGALARDGLHWTATQPLQYGKTYKWSGSAVNADGERSAVSGDFSTAKPENLARANLNIDDGSKVGIAAPIILQFDGPVQNKAGVERALSVRTSIPTEGSWAWLPDNDQGSRVHWRPKEYWKPGTQVSVDAKLYGVPYGNGTYGKENVSTHFTIDRAQITRGDTQSHHLLVFRDGKQVADYPASYGLDSDPERTTHSGIHVVSGKSALQRMREPRFGYDTVEPNAVQISGNGEFIHTNTETVGDQGSDNVTHGCVNLDSDNGKEYFDSAEYGDPVEITGSSLQLSEAEGDIYDWTKTWDEWRSMSALKQPPPPRPATPQPVAGAARHAG